MRRRELIALLGGSAAWSIAANAQQSMPTIGFLNSASPDLYANGLRTFRKGLAEADYIEGRNVGIEYRWADGRYERLTAMANDLIQRACNVIFANGPAAPAAQVLTAKIPIVFATGVDPVKLGLVASLSKPGGNLTGVSILNSELGPKRLELLRELMPSAKVVALLVNPSNPNANPLSELIGTAANLLGVQIHVLQAKTDDDLDKVFVQLNGLSVDALVIGNDPFFTTRSERLAHLTLRHSMPAIYQYGEFTAAGGLMSYGSSLTDTYYKAGLYVGRILKGETPANLPVQQSTKVELVINLKTAKLLQLNVPLSLLGRADEVIE